MIKAFFFKVKNFLQLYYSSPEKIPFKYIFPSPEVKRKITHLPLLFIKPI